MEEEKISKTLEIIRKFQISFSNIVQDLNREELDRFEKTIGTHKIAKEMGIDLRHAKNSGIRGQVINFQLKFNKI